MAKNRPAPTPPKIETVVELDPQKIDSLEDLQKQARHNTRILIGDARQLDELKKEEGVLQHTLLRMEDNPTDSDELVRQQQNQDRLIAVRKQIESTEKEVNKRRARSGALVRKRMALEKVKQQELEREHEAKVAAVAERLSLSTMVERHKRLMDEIAHLATDAGQAQLRIHDLDQRDLVRRLLALQRACFASLESLKRVPELVVLEEV